MTNFKEQIAYLFFIIGTFITPIVPFIIIASFVVAFDTLLAIYYNVKKFGLASIVSHRLFNIVPKTFFYMGSILFAFLIDKYIIVSDLFQIKFLLSKAVTSLWIIIEIKSIDETSIKLGNRPILQILKDLINKAKEFKKDLNEIKK